MRGLTRTGDRRRAALLAGALLGGTVLAGLLGGCTRPPQDDLRLTPLPTLTLQGEQLLVTGAGPLRVTCDTPAGPVVHTLTQAGQVPVPPGAVACEASRPVPAGNLNTYPRSKAHTFTDSKHTHPHLKVHISYHMRELFNNLNFDDENATASYGFDSPQMYLK